MSGTTLTLDHMRRVRRRIDAYLGQEIRDLGADGAMLAQQAAAMSGLEFMQRWLRPEEMPPPPPLGVLFSIEWIEIEPSRAALAFEPAEWMLNGLGAIHGGITATLLDTVFGAAVHTTLPAGTGYATTDLHIRYLRPMNVGKSRVIATAAVVRAGRRQATAEGRVQEEATGELIATGTTGCAILRPS
jgi:uncharacterized protein (TIGR00369 family)